MEETKITDILTEEEAGAAPVEAVASEPAAAPAAPETPVEEAPVKAPEAEEKTGSEPVTQAEPAAEEAASEPAGEPAAESETAAPKTTEEKAPEQAGEKNEPNAAAQEESAETPAKEEPVETMADYSKELEASFKKINEGDILTGTVIGVTDTEITLDFGYYTDGIIRLEDASNDPSFSIKNDIQIGQTLSAMVKRSDDGAGHILLSMKEAADVLAWDHLKEMMDNKQNVSVKISGVTKSGVVAYLEGVRGFIPASKLTLNFVSDDALPDFINKTVDVRVVTVDKAKKRLVMSCRDILREKAEEERARKVSNVKIGLVTEGKVETLKPYGAFIDLGNGLSGMVHVSQISQQHVKQPSDVLKEGQTVKVKVIGLKDGKISLSMKAVENETPTKVEEETYRLPKSEEVTTSLGSLFAKLKL